MKTSHIYSLFLLILLLLAKNVHAQRGLMIQTGAAGGLSFIAAQNHYDNSNYQLNYQNTPGFSGSFGVGYGFRPDLGIMVEAGYQRIRQDYTNQFSPGLGFQGPGVHNKAMDLSYYQLGLYGRFSMSFVDDYVYDAKLQGYIAAGFQLGWLGQAKMDYVLDGNVEPYPSKIRPYVDEDYPYAPVANDKDLFTPLAIAFALHVGLDWFIVDKLAISPSLRANASLTDINAKAYRKHEDYKASRYFFGGFFLGVSYYFNRG